MHRLTAIVCLLSAALSTKAWTAVRRGDSRAIDRTIQGDSVSYAAMPLNAGQFAQVQLTSTTELFRLGLSLAPAGARGNLYGEDDLPQVLYSPTATAQQQLYLNMEGFFSSRSVRVQGVATPYGGTSCGFGSNTQCEGSGDVVQVADPADCMRYCESIVSNCCQFRAPNTCMSTLGGVRAGSSSTYAYTVCSPELLPTASELAFNQTSDVYAALLFSATASLSYDYYIPLSASTNTSADPLVPVVISFGSTVVSGLDVSNANGDVYYSIVERPAATGLSGWIPASGRISLPSPVNKVFLLVGGNDVQQEARVTVRSYRPASTSSGSDGDDNDNDNDNGSSFGRQSGNPAADLAIFAAVLAIVGFIHYSTIRRRKAKQQAAEQAKATAAEEKRARLAKMRNMRPVAVRFIDPTAARAPMRMPAAAAVAMVATAHRSHGGAAAVAVDPAAVPMATPMKTRARPPSYAR
eukprot:PLAT14360.1.p1 GENE.PLAT14360.1~~PLAT14360.1.p1  ORF type:complete len:466 (+),score=119.64 PLAT14360.1:12-1409(+)